MPAASDAMLRDNYHEIETRYTCLEEGPQKASLKRRPYTGCFFFFIFGYVVVTSTNISALELSLEDLENRSSWFASNYLSVNAKKTQAMILVSTPMNLLFILATLLSE